MAQRGPGHRPAVGHRRPETGDGGWVIREPKTPRSRRQVPLPQAARDSRRRHRVAQGRERLKLGEVWTDHDLVFPNTVGRP